MECLSAKAQQQFVRLQARGFAPQFGDHQILSGSQHLAQPHASGRMHLDELSVSGEAVAFGHHQRAFDSIGAQVFAHQALRSAGTSACRLVLSSFSSAMI